MDSIVIPVYNGAASIGEVVSRLVQALGEDDTQIVLVNDGSVDASDRVCRSLQATFPGTVVYLKLARNFGEHNAVMAGLHHAAGDHVVIMDDDLQNPPSEVPRLIEHARVHGYDVVYTFSATKEHHWARKLGSRFNDLCANLLLEKPRGLYLSSFKCMNRFVVKEVIKYTGPYPYVDGLVLRSTRNIGAIQVRHLPRAHGRSNYTLGRLVCLWARVFLNFSVMPLRLGVVFGFASSLLGLVLGLVMVVERLVRPDLPVGWASVIVAVLVLGGTQLVMLGMLGEYIGRLYLTSNQTPQFVVREVQIGEAPPCAPHRRPIASATAGS
jgi:undecaprenyl-phosphate 4-deoxy-4-formamido-L-arabinose transferase